MLYINPEHFILKPAFAKIHCEPNWKWRKREKPMPNYDLFYVWNGSGELVLNRKTYLIEKGHCFLFKPGDETTATHDPQDPLEITYIHFDVMDKIKMIPAPHRVIDHTISIESLLTRYVRVLFIGSPGAEIEAKLILKLLMIQLLREEQEYVTLAPDTSITLTETIREIANYVKQNPGQSHTVESLAARANLSERYFAQKFKEVIGQTVKSYIIQCRIRRAEHLLYFTGMNVTETAAALGYTDLHFFSRQFKQYTGKNPSEIR
jgi:AraC-like DNA-binding protein